jgi:hypothetical protein
MGHMTVEGNLDKHLHKSRVNQNEPDIKGATIQQIITSEICVVNGF